MNVLEFIFAVLVLFVLFISFVGGLGMKYDSKRLNEENEKLREELRKARLKKSKEVKKDVK